MAAEDDPGLCPGDIIRIGREASCQFAARPFYARYVRVMKAETERTTLGWCWLEVLELNDAGDAVLPRQVYLQPQGITRLRWRDNQNPTGGRRNVRRLMRDLTAHS